MKPLDWILLVISLTGLYTFFAGLLFTPKIVFELMPKEAEAQLRRRFYWFIFPAILMIWRVWG